MQKPFDVKGVRFGEGRPVICVPVVARERSAIIAKIRALTEKKVQMIEWRADCFDRLDQPDEVRGVLEEISPMVQDTVMLFTIRTKNQGGHAVLSEREILYRDEIAAKSGSIDMIDLEYFELDRPQREIRRLQQMGVRVIVSHHDFSGTPQDAVLYLVMDQLAQSGGDIAKLAVMPDQTDDLLRLLGLTAVASQRYPDLPLITIAMGNLGVVSRVTGEAFGSCITFGADGAASAPGQLKADTLSDILDALHESMNGDTDGPAWGRHLFLIGFMGVGKTTVSRQVSRLLDLPAIDLDEAIVDRYGMPVAEMFERLGEPCFRERETEMLQEIVKGSPGIVSCGGGCVLRGENVSVLKESGTVVLLTADPSTIYERVKNAAGRPLLDDHMDPAYIADLMAQREEAYDAACDLRVCTDGKTPEQIAEEIVSKIR